MTSWLQRIGVWMERPSWTIVAAVVGVVLGLSSLNVGLIFDDYWHHFTLSESADPELKALADSGHPLDLFAFFKGDEERSRRLIERGMAPWWLDTTLKGAFWRPVTSATHWLDYQLWPDSPVLMHAQSVLWYGLSVAAVGILYFRIFGGGWVAGLAALLFAVDDGHGMPVGFLANRNALIALFFTMMSMNCHCRWRGDGWRWGAILGPILFAVGLLSAEAGVGVVAYLFAYGVCLDRGGWRKGLLSLWAYGVVLVGWRLIWQALGYGVSPGMGFYIDPLREPVDFLVAMVERGPILMFGQWVGLSDASFIMRGADWVAFWGAGVLVTVLVVWVMGAMGRSSATARFWLIGMLLAIVPICAVIPQDRMLLFAGVGGMGLLAEFVRWVNRKRLAWRGFRRAAAVCGRGALLVIHLGLAPLLLGGRSANPSGPKEKMAAMSPSAADESRIAEQDLIIVNTPMYLPLAFCALERSVAGLPIPEHIRLLGPSWTDLAMERTGERTVVVRPDGGFLVEPFDRLFRGRHKPFEAGDRIVLPGMVVTVSSVTEDGRPAEVTYAFAESLDSERYEWIVYRGSGYESFEVPSVGATVEVPFEFDGWF